MTHSFSSLAVAGAVALLATFAACAPVNSAGNPDGGIVSGVCGNHTTCDDCIADFDNNCAYCGGACVVNPQTHDEIGGWCSYGFTKNDPKVCSELDGGALLPTSLPIDCRAEKNWADPRCAYTKGTPDTTGQIGTGPAFPEGAIGSIRGGFLDAANNRLILGAWFNNANADLRHGAIFSVDLATGNRTLVSATYVDGQQTDVSVGAGEALPGVADVKPSPDGSTWYAITGHAGNVGDAVFKIDPKTGDRTVLYDATHPEVYAGNNPQCLFAKTNWALIDVLHPQSMAVAANGTMYLSVAGPIVANGTDAQLGSVGIGTLTPDGTCKIISVGSQDPTLKLGSGPVAYGTYTGLELVGNTLYAESMGEVHAIDVTTGNRKLVSSTAASPKVGSGPVLQDGYLHIENATTLLSSGPEGSSGYEFHAYDGVDLATGNRTPHDWVAKPFPNGLSDERWVQPYPAKPGIFIAVIDNAVLLFEPKTGASMVASH